MAGVALIVAERGGDGDGGGGDDCYDDGSVRVCVCVYIFFSQLY